MRRRYEKQSKSSRQGKLKNRKGIWLVLILCITAALYINTFDNDYTNWDDINLILKSSKVGVLSAERIARIFSIRVGSTYQPIRDFSYSIDHTIFGARYLLFGLHLHNLLLYLVIIFLLYKCLFRILHSEKLALLATGIFAVHPLHVESVTYLAARKEVLFGTFFLLSLYLFLLWVKKRNRWFLIASYGSYLISVLSKPQAVTLPLVLLFYWLYFKRERRIFLAHIPYWIITFPGVIYSLFLAGTTFLKGNLSYQGLHPFIIVYNLAFYIGKMFLPVGLVARYQEARLVSLPAGKIILAFILLAVMVYLVIYFYKKNKIISFFILWFYVNLLPTMGFVKIAIQKADRYALVSSVGYAVCIAYLIGWLAKLIKKPSAVYILTGFLIAFYSILTVQRNDVWQTAVTVWEDANKKTPGDYLISVQLGNAYIAYGKFKEAIPPLYIAYDIDTTDENVLGNLVAAYAGIEECDSVIKYANKLEEVVPPEEIAHYNNYSIGVCYRKIGDIKNAERFLRIASAKEENSKELVVARVELANLLFNTSREKEAVDILTKLYQEYPDNSKVAKELGICYYQMGMREPAEKFFEKYLELKPGASDKDNILKAIEQMKKDKRWK